MTRMERVYGRYCREHDGGNGRLEMVRGREGVDIWLRACGSGAKGLTNAWDLESLLIKPVQRVLKYPLLLTQLLECTPDDHPDYTALELASSGIKSVADSINTQKKRKDIVDKITSRHTRPSTDIRHGITKVLARRTEKLKQSVGLSEGVNDEEYRRLTDAYNTHYVQIQMVLRDVEMYIRDMTLHLTRFVDLAAVIREFVTSSGTSSFPDIEAKWRRYETVMRDLSGPVLNEHKHAIRTRCVEPLDRLIKLHESPQRIMAKREKRLVDYARFKALSESGHKVDKKTAELAEAFTALNETLKDELPRLFQGTKKLVLAVLAEFVALQGSWMSDMMSAVLVAFDELGVPEGLEEVVEMVLMDQKFYGERVEEIGICRQELRGLRLPSSLLSPSMSLREEEEGHVTIETRTSRDRRPSTAGEKQGRLSVSSPNGRDERRHSASYSLSHAFSPIAQQAVASATPAVVQQRGRSSSSASLAWPTGATVGLTASAGFISPSLPPSNRQSYEDQPAYPGYNLTTTQTQNSMASSHRLSLNLNGARPASPPLSARIENIYASHTSSPSLPPAAAAAGPFSSALPTSRSTSPVPNASGNANDVLPSESSSSSLQRHSTTQPALFLAASLYEFGFEGSRREGGFRYLTYVQGEIFDVVATKGEIWLARNQDDGGGELGWIWCKHFARLPV
ncbi:hypothetical protein BJ508DRAFT_151588 [Ascobolus immersus RN42]|uniref:Dynamin-binding protein n=1 Tax=Ascobolus immersus RN42 TaxID=1160509 RepID=A0A3N4HYQ5_ASCIM|nr:hypothetical protein BJ508DRAFT_151588 [Ascobolus immersus RN42]